MNEAPNNNDFTCLANIMLNEAPNSNDAMHIANNVHLCNYDGGTIILNGN